MKRTNLKVLRIKNGLTQDEMAEKLGVGLTTYNLIENGKRNGSLEFWYKVQMEFKLTGEDIWKLQNPHI